MEAAPRSAFTCWASVRTGKSYLEAAHKLLRPDAADPAGSNASCWQFRCWVALERADAAAPDNFRLSGLIHV
jgi:hypothetical protein